MIYQEKFDLDSTSSEYFSKRIDILICGLRDDGQQDVRCGHVFGSLAGFRGTTINLRTDENAQSLQYKISDAAGNVIKAKAGMSLIPDLRKFLSLSSIEGSSVCIDITCLQQPILFLLVKILITEVKPRTLLAAYTEPKRYRHIHESEAPDEEFELYDRIVGGNYSVPGFAKISRADNELLVAPFGFERQRLISLYESVEPKGGLIPILGFPAFVPGWNLTALYMNYKVIGDAMAEQKIRFCDASSPFALYKLLDELDQTYCDTQKMLLAPLGTRPHSLGAALFATKNKRCHLIYDFPVEKMFRSDDILKANIYHLSNFIESM